MAEDTQDQGPPDPIDTTIEEVRFLERGDAKLYTAKAVLLDTHSHIYDFKQAHLDIQGPVPVIADDGKQIGYASVYRVASLIKADIVIDYATEERLMAETQSQPLYARPFGTLTMKKKSQFIDLQERLEVVKMVILGVTISRHRPAASHIAPLGAPVF